MTSNRLAKATRLIKATPLAAITALLPFPAAAEIEDACSTAVGTFLTKNDLGNNGQSGASRSLLMLTSGGRAIRFDSDEMGAVMDSRPFGDSAGTWRCDGVGDNGTVRLTVSTLDFTYPNAEGDPGQIARIDVAGTYTPDTGSLVLKGTVGFLPLDSEAQRADALSQASETIAITLNGQRLDLPSETP